MTPKELVERLNTVREGMEAGLDDWPIASQIWEYKEAATAIEQLRARVAELEAENARLIREVVNRNQRALDGDKAVKAEDTLYEQLTNAEQRVAEACALTYLEDYDLTDIADRVRDGEWRKFVKEV